MDLMEISDIAKPFNYNIVINIFETFIKFKKYKRNLKPFKHRIKFISLKNLKTFIESTFETLW